MLLGTEAMAALERARVAVVGLGGVGSWAAEALARSGVGGFVLIDDDSVCITNMNRQVIATSESVGRPKVQVMAERIRAINPGAAVEAREERFGADTAERLLDPGLSYVVDAIDTVSAKIELIVRSRALGLPIISAMGMGNKLDPTRIEVADIRKTSICPLARVMRKELRRRGIESLKVIYSREEPIEVEEAANPCRRDCVCPKKDRTCAGRRSVPGSVSFVPPAAGLIAASVVARDLIAPYRRPSRRPS
jgi:tRNA threonylcarbamoyladenosine dehydratase